LNAPTTEEATHQVVATGIALFGEVARMYEEGYLGRENPESPSRRTTKRLSISRNT
jgi:hypothetical protein